MVFNRDTKELLALPFFKFFNYNENDMYSKENISSWKIVNIYDKVDGSLIYFFNLNGDLICKTQRSCNNVQSRRAMELITNRPDYKKLIWKCLNAGYTPLFELVSPNVDPHIVRYNFNELVFLGMRNMKTGELVMPTVDIYMFLAPAAQVTTILPTYKFNSLEDLLRYIKIDLTSLHVTEGYTVLFNNNELVKFKTSQYLKLHKLADSCMKSDVFIVKAYFNGTIDDIKASMRDNIEVSRFIDDVVSSVSDVWNKRLAEAEEFYNEYGEYKEYSIKEYIETAKEEGMDKKVLPIAIQYYKCHNDWNQPTPKEHEGIVKSFIASKDWRESYHFDKYRDRFN